MTSGFTGSMPSRGGNWLQDIIRDREPARLGRQMALPAGEREISLQTENFPTPESAARQESRLVSVSRNIRDYCVNTLKYIGEHPVEFALSIGTAMAVRWGVTAGLIAFGGAAIGGLGLAIAAAMITSVVLGVGRAVLKGEKLDSEKLVGRSLLSGVIAGVIGGFLGGYIPSGDIDTPSTTTPQTGGVPTDHGGTIHHPVPPKGIPDGDAVDHHPPTKPITEHRPTTPHSHTRPSIPTHITPDLGFDVTDKYVWGMQDADTLRNGYDLPSGSYTTVRYGAEFEMDDLVRQHKDWVVLLDAKGDPYQAIHKDAVKEMMDFARAQAKSMHLKGFDDFYIVNDPYSNAETRFMGIPNHYQYDLAFNSGKLAHDIDMYQATLYHELGHVKGLSSGVHDHMGSHAVELDADACALQHGYYGPLIENQTYHAIQVGNLDYVTSSHPTARERITEAIEAAAKDEMTAKQRMIFENRLQECQQLLHKSSLRGEIDLMALWKQAQLHETHSHTEVMHTHAAEETTSKWASKVMAEKNSGKFLS